jgi:DNA-binding beta-propeller fold protein YncE
VLPGPALRAQEPPTFEYLFTIGANGGVNPKIKASGQWSQLLLGAPERLSPLSVPAAVAVDQEDRIWIADRGAARVFMFDILGGQYKSLAGSPKIPFQCPAAIDVDHMGMVYVADACSGFVFVFDRDGVFERMLVGKKQGPLLKAPSALLVSPDRKRIFIADPQLHKVVVLNQEGESVQEWGQRGKAPLEFPTALAFDRKEKRVLVLDSQAGSISAFTLGGEFTGSMRFSRVRSPSAIAFDSENRRYFVGDAQYEAVHVFAESGDLLASFGQSGSGLAECRVPQGLTVDFRGRIFVIDALNSKVLVFREAQGLPLPLPPPDK